MKRIGLFLLAVVLVVGLAGCPKDDTTRVTVQVYDSRPDGIDDAFTVEMDEEVLGQTPFMAGGGTYSKDLKRQGEHYLTITYSAATDNDGVGTFGAIFIEGAHFANGLDSTNYDLHGIGAYITYRFPLD